MFSNEFKKVSGIGDFIRPEGELHKFKDLYHRGGKTMWGNRGWCGVRTDKKVTYWRYWDEIGWKRYHWNGEEYFP